MFFYPLPVPRNTLYQKLGVDPEAPADEIRNAKTDFVNGLKRRKDVLDQKVEAVLDQVEGLRKAYTDQREFENKGREAETELAAATKRVHQLEKQALRLNPDFIRIKKEAEDIDAEINEVNSLAVENPEKRQEYDKAHPPLALLKLTEWPDDAFTDNKTALALLRRELADFLAAEGEVFHPSDLTRRDFRADFTPNPRLDGPPS